MGLFLSMTDYLVSAIVLVFLAIKIVNVKIFKNIVFFLMKMSSNLVFCFVL